MGKIILSLKARYRLLSAAALERLLIEKQEPKNICHISFDVGYKSFYTVVYSVLKKYNVPVSLFVSTEVVMAQDNYWFQEIKGYDEQLFKKILANQLNILYSTIRRFPIKEFFKCLPANTINHPILTI